MKHVASFCILSVLAAGAAIAQETKTAIIAAPGGANEFCYFGGLAYSQNAILLIDVTDRRESPQATQKAMMECKAGQVGENLKWERISDN